MSQTGVRFEHLQRVLTFKSPYTNVMFCAILYHLCNLKKMENTHGGVLILVKLHAFHRGCFSRF